MKEKREKEIKHLGWKCTFPSCNWTYKSNNPESLEYWKVAKIFGPHNLKEHGGSIQASMEKIFGSK